MSSILFLGASSDIATATARIFAENHFDIQLAGRNIDYLNRVKTDLEIRYGVQCDVYFFDALGFDTHNKFVYALKNIPDITVCAFGYLGDQTLAQVDWEESKKILDTNLIGAISILNRIADIYEKNRKGIIVGITSVAGERGRKSNYIYGSAKAGFTAYLSGLRHRLFSLGIPVISIKPGFVKTKMTSHLDLPPKLTATSNQVAAAIYSSVQKNKNTVYVKSIWRYIMIIIRQLPENLFKRTKL
jgi:short-subunit dehydrogenase